MAFAALNSLCTTIRDLETSSRIYLSSTSVPILKLACEAAECLIETMELLDETSKSCSRKNVNALDERIKEAIWKFEDLLDSHLYHQIFPQSQILGVVEVHVDEIRDDIESFAKMLEELEKEYMYELDHLSPEEDEDVDVDVDEEESEEDVNNCKMVGSSDLLWSIRNGLETKRSSNGMSFYQSWAQIRRKLEIKHSMNVISLVGMAGIGKTTLARKIFDDPLVFTGFEFECRAWVTIGRKWESHRLRRDIRIQLKRNIGCCPILKPKRCLIVLDDVWDTDVFDHFKRSLPICILRRTLVLLTTRLRHVAGYADVRSIYAVELLNDDESWDLLRQRVFGEEGECPWELEKAGKKIAQICDGLPLMILTVANLLLEAEMTEEYWESVAKEKNSSIFMTAYDRLYEVLFPSYDYLPQHLKPSFLHMGVFHLRCGMKTSMILLLWKAEGFLLPFQNETIEECSERYLRDLFDHSVFIICKRSLNYDETGKGRQIKSCRLQSAFWHLCKREATNTKFFHLLSTLDDVEQSMINTQRRLSFHNNILFGINDLSDKVGDVCAFTARSLLLYGPYYPYHVPISFNLRLLKVLDAFQIRFYEFPMLVFQLVYLRFLALTYNGKLPASISKLWNLRFLIICNTMSIKYSGLTSYMPTEIWDMKELKHLQVTGSNLPNPSSGASLERLLRLKYVGVETCTKEVLERVPNLKKLAIQVDLHPDDDDDGMKALYCLNHVHVLHELTSLTCNVWNPFLRSEIVALPTPLPMLQSSLKKLHLSGMGYPWSYMSVIGSLPHLQVLKLGSYAFRGSEWVVKDGQFRPLKALIINGTDLVKFKVEVRGFLGLRVLHFSNCYKLRDLQWKLSQRCLIITATDCSTSAVAFVNDYISKHEFCCIPKEQRSKYVISSYMK